MTCQLLLKKDEILILADKRPMQYPDTVAHGKPGLYMGCNRPDQDISSQKEEAT